MGDIPIICSALNSGIYLQYPAFSYCLCKNRIRTISVYFLSPSIFCLTYPRFFQDIIYLEEFGKRFIISFIKLFFSTLILIINCVALDHNMIKPMVCDEMNNIVIHSTVCSFPKIDCSVFLIPTVFSIVKRANYLNWYVLRIKF